MRTLVVAAYQVGTFVEARTDAYSMLVYRRRVMPMGAEDIGNWQKVSCFATSWE